MSLKISPGRRVRIHHEQNNETTPLLTERREPPNLDTEGDLEDSDVVDFEDGDPEHPYNWPLWQTLSNCLLVSGMTFLTALASSIIAPGVPQIMAEFHIDNLQLASFVVSVYILGFAAGPLIIAPLSEIYGRVPVYHVCNVGFTIFAIACALAPTMHTLIVFRFLNGLFGSCPATIGGGSITDMIPQERRARVMAGYSIGALFAPILGPMMGGLLAHAFGWRWDFWLLAIAGGIFSLLQLFILRETYCTVILARKVARMCKITGRKQLRSKLDSGLPPLAYFITNIVRPMKMLTASPIVIITSVFVAITYGYMYVLFTSITEVFQQYYAFNTSSVGICFLGLGLGSFLGVGIFSAVSDRILKAKAAAAAISSDNETGTSTKDSPDIQQAVLQPEFRLPPLPFAVLCLIFGLLVYGWTAELRLHWIIPVIGTVFIGCGQLLLYMVLQMYLIDSFTIHAASAVAALTAVRSVAGAFLPLIGLSLYEKFGVGWGNTLLAAVCLPLLGVSLALLRWGEWLREHSMLESL